MHFQIQKIPFEMHFQIHKILFELKKKLYFEL